ncbi:hypothetical protein C0993_008580 [Termitomyces sp. T159_Od127]|nr:hypothetical protein C0993_008580 [Termitomyces sp. T159_Od127]
MDSKTNATAGSSQHRGPPLQSHRNHSSYNKKQLADSHTLSKEERDELRAASKCFIRKKDGHFSRNCPDKLRQTSKNNKLPGISSNSIWFCKGVDLEQTEQLRINSLGETTTSLSIGMVKIRKIYEYMDDVLWGYTSEKEYNSDGDTIPDLQSVLDSNSKCECCEASNHIDKDAELSEDMLVDNDHKEVLLGPPIQFDRVYPTGVEDGEEKILLIEMEEGPCCHLGHAVAWKAEGSLEILQPYPGDPVNVLQY